MADNSININNKMNNHLSPQAIEHNKDHDIFGNPGPGLG